MGKYNDNYLNQIAATVEDSLEQIENAKKNEENDRITVKDFLKHKVPA